MAASDVSGKVSTMRTHGRTWLGLLSMLLPISSARADNAEELPSYLLLADKFVTADKSAADAVFYAYDDKIVSAKLKESGLEFPREFNFPGGSLFVIVISGYTKESFVSMSAVAASRTFIVDLQADKEKEPPKPAADGKKNCRLLLIGCPPLRGIKAWAIKTADGKRHEVRGTELKK